MRRLVIAVIVLLAILVVADRVALQVAEGVVATQLQTAEKLPAKPAVSIHGFPFLTQVLRGRYDAVDASLQDLTVEQGVEVDRVRIRLDGVHIPLKALIGGTLTTVPVDRGQVTGVVSYDNLNAAAAAQLKNSGLTVRFAQGKGDGDVALSGTYSIGTLRVKVSGEASIRARSGKLFVSIPADSLDVPDAIRTPLAGLLGTSYQLPPLPLDLQVNRVKVGSSGVSVTASGTDLTLGAESLTSS